MASVAISCIYAVHMMWPNVRKHTHMCAAMCGCGRVPERDVSLNASVCVYRNVLVHISLLRWLHI